MKTSYTIACALLAVMTTNAVPIAPTLQEHVAAELNLAETATDCISAHDYAICSLDPHCESNKPVCESHSSSSSSTKDHCIGQPAHVCDLSPHCSWDKTTEECSTTCTGWFCW